LHTAQTDNLLPIANLAVFKGPFSDPGGIVFHDGAFHMFFNVLKDFPPTEVSIGYATSANGLDWTLMTDYSILQPNQVPFTNNVIRAASALVEDDGTWVLFFDTVEEEGSQGPVSVIGRATAQDPSGPWEVDPAPILTPTEGSWDAYGVMRPCILKTDQGYWMYYQARDTRYGKHVFGLATSADSITWRKHPEPTFRGEQVAWGQGTTIRYPFVVKQPWGWVMFFRTSGSVFQNSIGIAISQDGFDWVLAQDQPIFETSNYPKWSAVFVLKVLKIDDIWHLFLELENLGKSGIHMATFKNDLIPGENITGHPITNKEKKTHETGSQRNHESSETTIDCQIFGLPEIACTGVSSNTAWTPIIRTFSNVEMSLVPAGCFVMGNKEGFPEQQPEHEICIEEPFWIDLTEVTVTQFADFLNGQPEPVDSHDQWIDPGFAIYQAHNQLIFESGKWRALPGRRNKAVESIMWIGANDFCSWRGARLPTEAEWEYANRGPDNWLYPWGNTFIADHVVRHGRIPPDVGSKPEGASWVGALDMSSGLFEWTSSIYKPYPYDPADGREASLEVDDSSHRVFRGSAWYHPDGMHDDVSATPRFSAPVNYAAWYYGVRCVRDLNP
jgi:iron(II)-dependent oxidoreductase